MIARRYDHSRQSGLAEVLVEMANRLGGRCEWLNQANYRLPLHAPKTPDDTPRLWARLLSGVAGEGDELAAINWLNSWDFVKVHCRSLASGQIFQRGHDGAGAAGVCVFEEDDRSVS